jgi:acyl-coenzyme A synthetase/AMP-(fatty) acid ligase
MIPPSPSSISYRELYETRLPVRERLEVSSASRKGDRVTIYLPMIPEIAVAMLACARIGAIHSVVFAGFSSEALGGASRIASSTSSSPPTRGFAAASAYRSSSTSMGRSTIPGTECVKHVLVVRRTGTRVAMFRRAIMWYDDLVATQPKTCRPRRWTRKIRCSFSIPPARPVKPKGVLHTTGGYLVYAAFTHQIGFRFARRRYLLGDRRHRLGDRTQLHRLWPARQRRDHVMFEGVPSYPDFGRFWQVVDKHQVTILYSSPTAIRSLMREGEAPVKAWSRKSLRLLGSVGEPINPEAWEWYHRVVGDGRCPIVDTWWQTETGGILITPLPGAIDLKPGSATVPFFGVKPAIVDNEGRMLEGACEGNLVLLDSWPGQMRTVYGDHQRFIDTYFKTFPGMYFTGDGARRDADGYYWITGRVDDVINVAGHRLGHRGNRKRPGGASSGRGGRRGWLSARHQRPGHLRVRDLDCGSRAHRASASRTVAREKSATPDALGCAGNQSDCNARRDPVGAWRAAENARLRKDHASDILRKIAANEHDQLGTFRTLAMIRASSSSAIMGAGTPAAGAGADTAPMPGPSIAAAAQFAFDRERNAHAAADAQTGESLLCVAANHLVQQRHQGCGNRMRRSDDRWQWHRR